jgi:hypothetical protein
LRRPWPVLICAACFNISAGLAIFGLLSALFVPMEGAGGVGRIVSALILAVSAALALLAAGGLWRMRRWGLVLALALVLLDLLADMFGVLASPGSVSLLWAFIAVVLVLGAARSWRQMSWAPLRIGEPAD